MPWGSLRSPRPYWRQAPRVTEAWGLHRRGPACLSGGPSAGPLDQRLQSAEGREQVWILLPFSPPLPGSSGTFCAQSQERMPLNWAFWASATPTPAQRAPVWTQGSHCPRGSYWEQPQSLRQESCTFIVPRASSGPGAGSRPCSWAAFRETAVHQPEPRACPGQPGKGVQTPLPSIRGPHCSCI